jgi:hypothetical protein
MENQVESKETKKPETNEPLECEEITIKLPKLIMDFLRYTDIDNVGPADWIEERVVDAVKGYLGVVEPNEIRDWFKLGPVFESVLGNKDIL